jgi:hypothetical protein
MAVIDGMVQYAGRLYITLASPLLQEVLRAVHGDMKGCSELSTGSDAIFISLT